MALSKVISKDTLQQSQLNALENEIISSSAIEGEVLDRDSVKSSIKEKLEIEVAQSYQGKTKESNYVDILLDANSNYEEHLTVEKLLVWHYKMFEKHNNKLWDIEVGNFRKKGTMQIVSGVDNDKPQVRYSRFNERCRSVIKPLYVGFYFHIKPIVGRSFIVNFLFTDNP